MEGGEEEEKKEKEKKRKKPTNRNGDQKAFIQASVPGRWMSIMGQRLREWCSFWDRKRGKRGSCRSKERSKKKVRRKRKKFRILIKD